MVIAPSVNVPSVMPSGRPMDYISVNTNPSMFGAGVGQAISGLGGTITEVAAAMQANSSKLATEQAKIDANNAFIGASLAKGQADAEYFSTTGLPAVTGYTAYTEKLAQIRKEAIDSLGTDEAKKLFDDDFQSDLLSGINGGATHAAKQQHAAVVLSAEQRLDLILQDSATKFGDDALFAKNLQTLDKMVVDLGAAQGWDEVTVLNKQFEQRSLAWEYRITSMANANPLEASKLFSEVRDGLTATSRMKIEGTVNSALNNRGASDIVSSVFNGDGTMARPELVKGVAVAGFPTNVKLGIVDRTRADSMQPRAMQILHGTAGAASEIGITLVVTAAEGGGHKSHSEGTEWDLKGYHADGSLWTPEERAYVARGGAKAGANRFGLYSFGAGYRGNGSLHIGYAGDGRPAAVWGYSGFTGGPESRNFTNAAERQFLSDFSQGRMGSMRGVPAGNFLDRILYAEGGGAGVTSHAGAVGWMQVMPATGAMVAAQLGIPFDAYRLANDYQYNMLIGTTYLNQMMEMFQGDEVLAAAAYNAGPGRVWKWLRENGDPRNGTISHDQWIAQIPIDETRNYVGKVMLGTGGAVAAAPYRPTGAASDQITFAEGLARVRAQAEFYRPGDVVFANQAVSGFSTRWNLENKAREEAEQENYDFVYGEAIDADDSGNRPTTREELLRTPELQERWEALSSQQKGVIDDKLAGNAAPAAKISVEELAEYDRLNGLFTSDFTRFREEDLPGNEILRNQPQLIKELIDLRRRTIAEGTTPVPDISITAGMRVAIPILKGIDITEKDNIDEFNKFRGALIRVMTSEQGRLGRALNTQEIDDIVQGLLVEHTYDRTSIDETFWSRAWGGTETLRVYQENDPLSFFPGQKFNSIEPELSPAITIPADIRKQITDAYVRVNGSQPSEAAIQSYYLKGLAKKKGIK